MNLPVCAISLGGNATVWDENLIGLVVECGLAPHVDSARITLAKAGTQALEDSGDISFGYDNGAQQTVFTGRIENLDHHLDGSMTITAGNNGGALALLRINQSYEQQKAGDIVNDLASRVSAATDTVQDGANLPFYILDDTRTAWRHIAELASLSGFTAYVNASNALCFEKPALESASATFTYGKDILALSVNKSIPVVECVQVVGQGASGSNGQEAWCWLSKDPAPLSVSSGSGRARIFSTPALRSKADIQNAAEGLMNAATLRNIEGRMRVPGAPKVCAGGTIELSKLPQSGLNGQALVQKVRHVFSKRGGFITEIGFVM